MNPISLSVSIVIYDLDELVLKQCLDSLHTAIMHASDNNLLDEHEITIVDNAQNRAALSPLTNERITYVASKENVGYGAAHNHAISSSSSKYHLVLNPDVVIEPDALGQFITLAEENSDICLIGPKGIDEAGENAYLPKRYPAVLDLLLRGFAPGFIREWFKPRLAHYEYRELVTPNFIDVELISGCCMFIKTDIANQIGAFDERYFLYFEDFDLSLRMHAQGRVVYAPAINILHYGGNSARKGINHIGMFCRAAFMFYNQHGWKLF